MSLTTERRLELIEETKRTATFCCAPVYEPYEIDLIDGECFNCGTPTIDTEAAIGCSYSPPECIYCNYSPCDGSC